jgi:hypothetical protein
MADAPALAVPENVTAATSEPIDLSSAVAAAARTAAERAHDAAREPSWAATSVTAETKHLPRLSVEGADALDAADPTRAVLQDRPSHRADAGLAWGTLIHGLLEHAMRHPGATTDDLRRLALWLTLDDRHLRPSSIAPWPRSRRWRHPTSGGARSRRPNITSKSHSPSSIAREPCPRY